jgi:hypothetical protein
MRPNIVLEQTRRFERGKHWRMIGTRHLVDRSRMDQQAKMTLERLVR